MDSYSIYIAGPVRGVAGWNRAAFDRAAEKLTADGWQTVYNPMDIAEMYGTLEQVEANANLRELVMAVERGFVARADAIYLLKGWEDSEGAKNEMLVALACGLKVIVEDVR